MIQEKELPFVLVIAGPTASGKTALAVELAHRFQGEVVSADSMQIYKGMEIGTAKPGIDEMRGIKHHLIDFLPIDAQYSVAQFTQDAKKAINTIIADGHLPIVCGGTGLYISALMDNIRFIDFEKDEKIRDALDKKAETMGIQALLSELAEFDPKAASELAETGNKKRIIHAIELYRLSGITISKQKELSRQTPSPYRFVCILLNFRDRQKLYENINKRVDTMLACGLEQEAKRVAGYTGSSTSSQAIGHKEFIRYFNGECTRDEAVEKLKRETRRYAKRQITWFKRDDRFYNLYVDEYASIDHAAQEAEKYIKTYIINN